MKKILGIDEAGRGAVLGPLVVAGVSFYDDKEVLAALREHKIRDSKLLSSTQRSNLAGIVRKLKHRYRTKTVLPKRIDKESLNTIEVSVSAQIINDITPHIAFLDVPTSGAGIPRYCQAVEEKCRHTTQIYGENKLDTTNVIVAAASILAKQRREKEVQKLHQKYGDFGSGYPSDPKTREWLKNWKKQHNGWPDIVRKKWSTIHKIARSLNH